MSTTQPTPRPSVRPSARRADALLVAATAIWGVSFVVVKEALAGASPLAFLALRFAIAAVVLAPFTDLRTRFSRAELRAGALLTLLLASGFAAQAVGLQYTTPSRSAFIVALSSVLAPVVAFVVLKQRPRWAVAAAVGLAGGGIYLLTAPDGGGLNRGDLWTLITAVVFGGQIVAVAELATRHDARRLVWLQLAGTALAAAAAAFALEPVRLTESVGVIGALVFTGVGATAVALVWQMEAQRHMSAARAALIFCLEPVFAAVASWMWLGERLSPTQWIGAGLILGGMVLAELPQPLKRNAL
ncbi:MAG TPA: DMT family transporter [Gemmatimonadales bacterium]|jgi:drug/metabolite transporter (DMT)-like permease|nr:DMT family transporter [Gemmatimonadales bacterium]